MIIFQVVLIIYSIINFIYMIRNYKKFHVIYPIIAVFDLVMVVPVFFELIWGIPDIPRDMYRYFIIAMKDRLTHQIYCSFILFAQLVFSMELVRIRKKDFLIKKTDDIYEFFNFIQNIKYKRYIRIFCYVIVLISVLSIVFSPNPMYFIKLRNVHMTVSDSISLYNKNIVVPIFNFLLLAIIVLKLIDSKNKLSNEIFRYILIIFFSLVNGKRTYLMIIVGIFFLIDLLKKGSLKKILFKYIIVFGAVAIYFYEYMYITDKISYNSDWYYEMHEYIFRSMHVRFSIYAALHPEQIHILDYPMQTIIQNLFFFIPRAIWPSKPYPYIDYYMMALLNLSSVQSVPFHMPASYYPEFVSNLGIIGLPCSLIFTLWVSRFLDKRKLVCKLLGTAIIALLNVYYYNDLLKIVVIFIIYLVFKEKYRFVYRR